MDSLYLIVIFCIFTECHGKAEGAYEGSVNCNRHNSSEGMFSCFYEKYHTKKRCMKVIKKFMQSAWYSSPTNECLAGRSKFRCQKCFNNENRIKETCKEFLSFCIESLRKQRSEFSGKSGEGVTTNSRNNTLNRNTDNRKEIFNVGAIVGISVGTTGTIIMILIILTIIYVYRQRSKKKRREQLTRSQSVDQRYDIANIISIPSSTNNEDYNKYLNTNEAQGEYFVLDPSVTKYHKTLSNRMLPEIKRCSDAEGDENVYYEIDEDKIEFSTDIGGVYQRIMEAVVDKDYHRCDQTRYETEFGPKKKNTERLTRVQSIDQKTKMTNLESNSSNTGGNNIPSANKSLNTDIDQGEYFVLDPSVTKYDKHLSNRVLPQIKRFSVPQCDWNVYSEIDEEKSEPSTDM